MRDRPLFSGCLVLFLLMVLCIHIGGVEFIKELRPSVMENEINPGEQIIVCGHVYDLDIRENYQMIYLDNSSVFYQNKSFKEFRIIVYDEEKLNIGIGNQIKVSGDVSFYEEERNPGNFNQKLYYQKQGICASVWASEIATYDENVNEILQKLYQLRVRWKQMLCEILGEEDGTVLSAILLAEKSGMNEETKELYQANGIGHILAISGLHLSVIGVGLYEMFRRFSGSFYAGGIAGISFLTLYILMIGMSVSVLRAFIMFLFRVGADMTGRHYDMQTALGFAACITIIWKPLCIYDGGFWLSYGAICAIILILPIFEKLPFQGFWASVSINIMTLPVLLYYFYEVPLYSVFLNMIVVPLMSIVLICGLIGSFCGAVLAAEGVFGICKLIFKIYEKICEIFLVLPGARVVAGQPQIWQIVLYYGVLLTGVLLWSQKKRKKWNIIFTVMAINVMVMLCPFDEIFDSMKGNMNITMLDVSQGDGIFIRGPQGNTYLIDGGSSDVEKIGKYRIEPFLKFQGVRKIDYVFVSHGDGDHINGIKEILERMDRGIVIENIVFPERMVWDENLTELAELAAVNGVRIVEMKAGQEFREGEMSLKCLAPVIKDGTDKSAYCAESNASSMVFALNYGEFDMLFTGDVEEKGEEILTEVLKADYLNVCWEVLKVAHHGSKNSSSEAFLDVVNPVYSLVSAGRNNSYGHPHEETLERLGNQGSKVLSTQECGAITIVTNGEKIIDICQLRG